MTIVNKYKVLCNVDGMFVSYHKGYIYIQNDIQGNFVKKIRLPSSFIIRMFQKVRLFERILRLEPRLAIPLNPNEFLLSYQGVAYKINCKSGQVLVDHVFRKTMNNPLSFCIHGNAVIYGEYFGNCNHECVSIYRREHEIWKKVYTFEEGTVLHIHQIVYDKYRECYWILTGDSDLESGIWKADLDFKKVTPLFKGKQIYRSCFLVPLQDSLVYATDTPLESNHLYVIRKNENGTWENPKIICKIPGPCIYGKIVGDGLLAIATSVEPDPTLPMMRYRVSYKLGNGVNDRFSHVIIGNPQKGFFEIHHGKKDLWPMNLCLFGNYQFPLIDCSDSLYVTGQAVSHEDGKTIKINLKDVI